MEDNEAKATSDKADVATIDVQRRATGDDCRGYCCGGCRIVVLSGCCCDLEHGQGSPGAEIEIHQQWYEEPEKMKNGPSGWLEKDEFDQIVVLQEQSWSGLEGSLEVAHNGG